MKNDVNNSPRDKSKCQEINEEQRKKKTRKRQGTTNKVNKSAIIGALQLEEQSQQESKRQKQEKSKKYKNQENTQAILLCFFVTEKTPQNKTPTP